MSDETLRLKAALRAAPPAPDPVARAAALARAMESFDAAQGSAPDLRSMSDRPGRAGLLTGVWQMFGTLTTRPMLAATTSVAALFVGLIVVLPTIRSGAPDLAQPPAPLTEVAEPRVRSDAAKPAELALDDGAAEPEVRNPDATLTEADTLAPPRSETAPTVAPTAAPVAARPAVAPLGAAAPAEGALVQAGTVAEEKAETAEVHAFAEALAAQPLTKQEADAAGAVTLGAVASDTLAFGEVEMAHATNSMPVAPAIVDTLVAAPEPDTEAFANAAPNPVRITADEPVSTFSTDVDTASYALVRSSLMAGYLPPEGAVRIEEMVNYFPYDYPAPEAGEAPFRPSVQVVQTPWNPDTQLVHIALQGRMPALEDRPALNLVFLIDTSGSMQDANKLPLLKQSFRLMLGQLRPTDQVAIVTYAGSAGQVLAPTPASDTGTILAALERLEAGGSTAGQEGLQQAYALAETMAEDGEVTRVILATDGDFNVGISDPEALKTYIEGKRGSGTYLSVLGFGRGNIDDATMQALAQNGNGQAAYIDTLSEAQKVLVDQLTGALFPIANDVKVQIEFNPAVIAEYRLIGYETRALRREDFNNDRVDAGDIGAGHRVTAIYEVTPVGSPAVLSDPLRYSATETPTATPEAAPAATELGFLKLRYKEPGASTSQLLTLPITPAGDAVPGTEMRFAIAMAGFGQLLTGASYLGDWGWDEAIALANGARGEDPFGYRSEAVQMMRLAESLSR